MVDLNHNINEKDNSNMVDISSDKERALNAAFEQINKKYGKKGEKAIMLLSEAPRRIERQTTGSMKVDIAIGGGLPKGRIIEIYGPESSGKTLLTLTMVAAQQRAGKVAAFVDAEHAFDPEWAARIGVDVDKLAFSQPNNGEQALEITELLIRSGAVDIIVVDSVAALTPQSELDGDMDQSSVGVQARMMSKAMRKITGAINESQCTVIFINQLREKIGVMFGSPETTTGGKALKFYASIRLDVRRTGQLKEGTDVVGISTKVTVVKNKTAPPFKKAEYEVITEGEHVGIQLESEIRDLAVDNNLISKSGAFYKFGDKSIQGGAKAAQFLRENDDIREDLLAKLREIYFPEPKEDDGASEVVDTNTLDELPED